MLDHNKLFIREKACIQTQIIGGEAKNLVILNCLRDTER